MSQPDMVNHPPHYAQTPPGVKKECIEYTRLMPFSQGNAFKYVYRLGNKVNSEENLKKALFYLADAMESNIIKKVGSPGIDTSTLRSCLLALIADGNLFAAWTDLQSILELKVYDRLDELENEISDVN